MLSLRATFAACLLAAAPLPVIGDCTEDAMLVFDASGSMAEMGYNGLDLPRIFEARTALHEVLPRVTPLRNIGLVVYGPGQEEEMCNNVELRLPPLPDAAGAILAEIDSTEPDGSTPLTRAVSEAADALQGGSRKGTVVLVTDGKETCGGATCNLATQLSRTDVTVHVIGFKVRAKRWAWQGADANPNPDVEISVARCLADRTGGLYVSAETTEELVRALQQTLGCPVYGQLTAHRPDQSRHR